MVEHDGNGINRKNKPGHELVHNCAYVKRVRTAGRRSSRLHGPSRYVLIYTYISYKERRKEIHRERERETQRHGEISFTSVLRVVLLSASPADCRGALVGNSNSTRRRISRGRLVYQKPKKFWCCGPGKRRHGRVSRCYRRRERARWSSRTGSDPHRGEP